MNAIENDNITARFLGNFNSGLSSNSTYHFVMLVVGSTGYVTTLEIGGRGEHLLFDQAVWYVYNRVDLGKAIGENRKGLEEVILCENVFNENGFKTLSVDKSFHSMPESQIDQIKLVISHHKQIMSDAVVRAREIKRRTNEVYSLLRDFRYQDAKDHCEVFELDYKVLLGHFLARNRCVL